MAMSRLMIVLSYLAALTFVSDASFSAKIVFYIILYTIARVDWSDVTTGKPTDNALVEIETEPVAAESPTAPLDADFRAVEKPCVNHGEIPGTVDPTIETIPIPVLNTTSQDTKHRSRATSISSTTSVFDKPTSNDRPSTPDTEIGDIPEFSNLAAKYDGNAAAFKTEHHTEPPSIAPSTQLDVLLDPITPIEHHRPQPSPPPSMSVTKYSMKHTELDHAVDDLSIPTPLASATPNNKRKIDTLEKHEVNKMAREEGDDMDVAMQPTGSPIRNTENMAAPELSTVPKKKKKLNSRQRRQRALRQAAGGVRPKTVESN